MKKILKTLNEVPFNCLLHDSKEIKFSGRQVRVVYVFVVLSLEPVESSSVRGTFGTEKINRLRYRKNYSDIQRIISPSGRFNDTLQK